MPSRTPSRHSGYGVALLDLSAAFDTVDYEILLDRLQLAFGIRGTAFKWIESFVTGRTFV